MSDLPKRISPSAVWAVVVFLTAFLLYANTLHHEFVWDDVRLIVENPRVHELNVRSVKDAFLSHYLIVAQKQGSLYRPLTTLSYQLDYHRYGSDASGFHLTNVLLNAIHCLLVFVFVRVLFGRFTLAVAAALLYATLPLHTENVAWVAGRTDLLSGVWMTAALVCYVLWRRGSNFLWATGCVLSFALGLLSKEIALTVPPMLLFVEIMMARRLPGDEPPRPASRPAVVILFVCMLLVAVAYVVFRTAVVGGFTPVYPGEVHGVRGTAALSLSIVAGYVLKILYPFSLNAEYEVPIPDGIFGVYPLVGFVSLCLLGYLGWRFRRRAEYPLGVAIFLLALLPVLNVVPIAETAAERFLYYPSLGSSLVLAAVFAPALSGAWSASQKRPPAPGLYPNRVNWTLSVVFAGLILAYAGTTVSRNTVWQSEESLFSTTVSHAGKSARAHLNLGNTFYKKGNYRVAIEEYDKALAIDPRYAGAWSSKAGAYLHQGQPERALEMIQRALAIEPRNANFLSSQGTIYSRLKRFDEAAASFEAALASRPDHADARFNYALSEYMRGDFAKAISLFEGLPQMDTRFVRAHYYIAVMEADRGNREKAREHAERFLTLYKQNDELRKRAESIASQ